MANELQMNIDSGLNLYQFNQAGMNMYDPLDRIALGVKVSELAKDLFAREKLKYWMLLNNENRDYTIFNFLNRDNTKQFKEDFIETLLNRGAVLDIEKLQDGNYEIWIKDIYEKNLEPSELPKNMVYYFFDYSDAVIEI